MSNTPTAFTVKTPGAADHVRIYFGDKDAAGIPVYVLTMDDARGIYEALHELFTGAAPTGHVPQPIYDALLDKYHDLAVRGAAGSPTLRFPPLRPVEWRRDIITEVGSGNVTAADGLTSHNID